jgi:Zn-dependent protease
MDILFWVMVVIAFGGLLGLTIALGVATQNKDNASEIQKTLVIIAILSCVLVAVFGVVAYLYLSVNQNYVSPFLFVLSFVNLFLGVFAVSCSTLQVSYAS